MNIAEMQPLANRVLLKRDMTRDTQYGDIIIAQSDFAKRNLAIAEVVAVGPDVSSETKVGGFVVVARGAGSVIEQVTEGPWHCMIEEPEIIADFASGEIFD